VQAVDFKDQPGYMPADLFLFVGDLTFDCISFTVPTCETRPFQLVTGRKWVGTAFGGWKTRSDVPKLVDQHLDGQLPLDAYVTHTLQGVGATNDAMTVLKSGQCLRCVVIY
jgi:Zn-dependent alcohol dehydrogenase